MSGDRQGRLASDYEYLARVDARGLAWEWLRRDADFRALMVSRGARTADDWWEPPIAAPAVVARWGCLHVERAELRADQVAILWSSAIDESVLRVAALPLRGSATPAFDLRRWGSQATMIGFDGIEHVHIGAGRASVRFDVVEGTLLDGPVRLYADLVANQNEALDRFRRFLKNQRVDRTAPSLFEKRQIRALRAHDALAAGASIRDIAIILFGEARVQADWRTEESLKSQCRRLIALARRMAGGGYKELLARGR